jgi:polyisoprenoid-binding protein YceI
MRKINLLTAILAVSSAAFAQTKWKVDKTHAKIGFTVTHLTISEVDGNFEKFDASITSSKSDFSDAVFEITAEVNSVNTDDKTRDNHIKGPDFFDAVKYPLIAFKSRTVNKIDDKKYKITGELTMHGVTKTITLDLILNGIAKDTHSQKPLAGFKVSGTINRNDFGVGSVPAAMIGYDIEIKASGEFEQM